MIMPTSRVALIVFGTYKDAWWQLSDEERAQFVARVAKTTRNAGIAPITGYRLTATPGAFLEVWEGADRAAVDRAVKDLQAMDYARYVEARWLIGERETVEIASPLAAQRAQRKR